MVKNRRPYKSLILKSIIVFLAIFCLGMIGFLIWVNVFISPDKTAQRIIATCSSKQKFTCFVKELSSLAKQKKLSYVQETVSEMQKIDKDATDCHLIAHYVSSIGLKKDPSRWKEIMLNQDPDICLGGYFHGILEEYFRQNGAQNIDKKFIQNMCLLFKEDGRKVNGCVHIMGHIILVQEKGDVDKAINICDQLPIDLYPFRCYNGVFMEYTTKVMLRDHGIVSKVIPATDKDILWMEGYCKKLKRKDAVYACWEEVGRLYMQFYKNDITRSLERCNLLKNEEYKYRCGSFVIVQWATINHELNPKILTDLCNAFEDSSVSWKNCILRISSLLLNVDIQYVPIVVEMCSNISQNFQEGCFRNISYNIFESKSVKKKEICNQLPLVYRKECG